LIDSETARCRDAALQQPARADVAGHVDGRDGGREHADRGTRDTALDIDRRQVA